MEFDPAIVLFGAVIFLLAAILIGGVVGVTWVWVQPDAEPRNIQDLDDFGGRVAEMSQQIAAFMVEIDDLYEEIERLQDERDHLLAVLLRIADILERFPTTPMPGLAKDGPTQPPDPPAEGAAAGSSGRGPWRS